jgi:hypothetical protein
VSLDATGPFGYTVRVLPRHEGLHDPAELGLQALPVSVQVEGDVVSTYAPTY